MVDLVLSGRKRPVQWLLFIAAVVVALATTLSIIANPLLAQEDEPGTNFLPVVSGAQVQEVSDENAVELVNQIRASARVPLVEDDRRLNSNCFEHARYMAENNILAHEQDPDLPFASPRGQACATNSNAWLGTNNEVPGWAPDDSVRGWMASVAHRLWLLYPTTTRVGFGFFSASEQDRAAAALDVLSYADFDADGAYTGWPVRYPRSDSYVPPTRYPITLNWRYFGPQPEIRSTQLLTADGTTLDHKATVDLPGGHKGLQIIPRRELAPSTHYTVHVEGAYDGQPFSAEWSFATAAQEIPIGE